MPACQTDTMTASPTAQSPIVVVTGANGLVGSRVCAKLVEAGASVRAVVRRSGSAPQLPGVEEVVGEFSDPALAQSVVTNAAAVVSTVHPMGTDEQTQRRVAVEGTPVLARAARDAGVSRLVHVSTAAVYDRSPGMGDVDETSALVGDDADAYAVTKRDTDAALSQIEGITTVLVRPPAILGSGHSSVWNSLRPAAIRDHEEARRANPEQTFAWVHLNDLSALIADLAVGAMATADDPTDGPVEGRCIPLNVAGRDHTTMRVYHETVCRALGVDPVWLDAPAWTGHYVADRAHRWGWNPIVDLMQSLVELENDLTG